MKQIKETPEQNTYVNITEIPGSMNKEGGEYIRLFIW